MVQAKDLGQVVSTAQVLQAFMYVQTRGVVPEGKDGCDWHVLKHHYGSTIGEKAPLGDYIGATLSYQGARRAQFVEFARIAHDYVGKVPAQPVPG